MQKGVGLYMHRILLFCLFSPALSLSDRVFVSFVLGSSSLRCSDRLLFRNDIRNYSWYNLPFSKPSYLWMYLLCGAWTRVDVLGPVSNYQLIYHAIWATQENVKVKFKIKRDVGKTTHTLMHKSARPRDTKRKINNEFDWLTIAAAPVLGKTINCLTTRPLHETRLTWA